MKARVLVATVVAMMALRAHGQDVEVRLEETGIGQWHFLNPKTPRRIGTDQSLRFRNETGSRTFVVTIPFEFRSGEFETSYTAASVATGVAGRTVSTFVGEVVTLTDPQREMLNDLEYLHVLREDVAAMKGDEKTFVDPAGAKKRQPFRAGHFEGLYWSAACDVDDDTKARIARGEDDPAALRKALDDKVKAFAAALARDEPMPATTCGDVQLFRTDTLMERAGRSLVGESDTLEGRARNAVLTRFTNARTALVKDTLLAAIDKELVTAYDAAQPVLQLLEDERRRDPSSSAAVRNCELRFLRTAASLIGSYGPTAKVPMSSPLLAVDDPQAFCATLLWPAFSGRDPQQQALQDDALQYARGTGDVDDVGFDISDCTGDAKTTCVARAAIPPRQRAVFPRAILERRTDRIIQFTVAFFDEAEPPANATGYVYLSSQTRAEIRSRKSPESIAEVVPVKLLFNFGGDAGADYALPKAQVESHVRRTTGSSSLGFQYIGPFDLSATLQFKKGEFGGGSNTNQVQASQYQAKVFGPAGTVLEYGRFLFAKPSSGIAISETGEGLRFSYNRGSLGYLIRRESDDPKQAGADVHDRDSYVLVGQVNAGFGYLRSLVLTGTWGNEEATRPPADNVDCDPAKTPPCIVPHTYASFGFDAKFPVRNVPNVVIGAAAYHSMRSVGDDSRLVDPTKNLEPRTDGKGDVALLTVSWSRLVEHSLLNPLAQAKPAFSLTGLLGYGSSDNPSTARDESYLGETAGYANDKLFLSSLAETKKQLGHGLANKWYAGFQYSNARWSPLFAAAKILKAESEVQSMSTTVSLHKYHFIREISCGTITDATICDAALAQGHKGGGYETDIEFLIETPKNVRWTLSGALYRRSKAVEAVGVKRNPWVVAANVSIKIAR